MPIQQIATIHDYPSAFQQGTYVWKDYKGLVVNIGKTTKPTSTVLSRNLQQDKKRVHQIISTRGVRSALYWVGPSDCETVMIGVYTVLNGRIPPGQKHPGRKRKAALPGLAPTYSAVVLRATDLRAFWPNVNATFTAERQRYWRMYNALRKQKNSLTGDQRMRAVYDTLTGRLVRCELSPTRTGYHNFVLLPLP